MPGTMIQRLPVYLTVCLLWLPLGTMANDNSTISQEEIEAQLKALEAEISEFKEVLESTQGAKSEVEKTLEQNEKSVNELIKQIEQIEDEIDERQGKISDLSSRQEELLSARAEQQHYIERQVRAAFEIGNQEYLKVLLNQEDPNEMARMLTYYDYFNEARAAQIQRYNNTLLALEEVSQQLSVEMAALKLNYSSVETERQRLAAVQREKQQTLATLLAQISETGGALKKREQDRAQLEQLLNRLQNSLANIPTPGSATPFSNMLGKLTLPVSGTISHQFGHRRNQGKMRWQGVFIDAPAGDPVYAVHYGRVVFSDWLRGFGLLLIISHGEGYMSLYGHNQVLYRETGDWVTAGDIIATVGDSGGQDSTGLYFEIRKDGKPSNPQTWCRARQHRAA